jgi:hypothetical protein
LGRLFLFLSSLEVTMKLLINRTGKGIRLSQKTIKWLVRNKGWTVTTIDTEMYPLDPEAQIIKLPDDKLIIERNQNHMSFRVNRDVIDAVEALGKSSSVPPGQLEVIDVPDVAIVTNKHRKVLTSV